MEFKIRQLENDQVLAQMDDNSSVKLVGNILKTGDCLVVRGDGIITKKLAV